MKKMLLMASFLCGMTTSIMAQDAVFNIEFGQPEFVQNYAGSDEGWHTTINNGEFEFCFDIIGKKEGLVSGKTYTLDNMNLFYSYFCDIEMGLRYEYVSVEYTETVEGARKKVEINVLGSDEIAYHLVGTVAASGKRPEYLPDDAEVFNYTFQAEDVEYGTTVNLAYLAFVGDDVYLQGCGYYSNYYKSAIKGKKVGDDLVFPAGQFLGAGKAYEMFIFGYDWAHGKLDDLIFYYEPLFENYVSKYDIVVRNSQDPFEFTNLSHYREASLVPEDGQKSGIEQLKVQSQNLPAKRWSGNKLLIRANGKDYDVLGR